MSQHSPGKTASSDGSGEKSVSASSHSNVEGDGKQAWAVFFNQILENKVFVEKLDDRVSFGRLSSSLQPTDANHLFQKRSFPHEQVFHISIHDAHWALLSGQGVRIVLVIGCEFDPFADEIEMNLEPPKDHMRAMVLTHKVELGDCDYMLKYDQTEEGCRWCRYGSEKVHKMHLESPR